MVYSDSPGEGGKFHDYQKNIDHYVATRDDVCL